MDSFTTTPQANDLVLRHVVMTEYYEALSASSALEIWYRSPSYSRRGNITRSQREFRLAFLKLISLTRYISQMSGMEEKAEEIDAWANKYGRDTPDADYYLTGVKHFKDWAKALFEQKIVEFR